MRHAVVAVLVLMLSAGAGEAAVRVCNPEVTSGPRTEANEFEARKAALDAWTNAAGADGPQFTSWRLATYKSLTCQPSGNRFQCEARAMPCAIQQQPTPGLIPIPKLHPESLPPPPPPSGKGISG
jgi:hypothetical protein